jgi:hypothetical protein
MPEYVGLDISMKETSICVLNGQEEAVFGGSTRTPPEAIGDMLRKHAATAERIVFETGRPAYSATSALPVIMEAT